MCLDIIYLSVKNGSGGGHNSDHSASQVSGTLQLLTWYTTVISDLIDALSLTHTPSLKDSQLRIISTFMLPGLNAYLVYYPASLSPRSIYEAWRTASIILLLKISKYTRFSSNLMRYILKQLIDTYNKSIPEDTGNGGLFASGGQEKGHNSDLTDEEIDDDEEDDEDLENTIYYNIIQVITQLSLSQTFLFDAQALIILTLKPNLLKSVLYTLKSTNISIDMLLQIICNSFITYLFHSTTTPTTTTTDAEVAGVSTPSSILTTPSPSLCKKISELYYYWVLKGLLPSQMIRDSLTSLLTRLCHLKTPTLQQWITRNTTDLNTTYNLIQTIARLRPELFDQVVQDYQTTLSTNILYTEALQAGTYTPLKTILSSIFQHVDYQISTGTGTTDLSLTLLVSLNSPSLETRLAALTQFSTSVLMRTNGGGSSSHGEGEGERGGEDAASVKATDADLKGLTEAVCHLLIEPQIDIVCIAWSEQVLLRVAEYTHPDTLLEACIEAFA